MKNPIKNGKEVFAVLSMATVMSISMSVKVDAASDIEVAAENAAHAVVENVDNAPSANKVEETLAAKEDTAKLEDNKEALVEDTKATDPGSPEVGYNSAAKTDAPAFEISEGNKVEAVRSAEGEATQAEMPQDKAGEGNKEDKLELGEERAPQAQQAGETEAETFKLKNPISVGVYDPKNLTDEEIANVKKAVVEANPALKNTAINVTKEGKVTFTDPDGKEQTIDAANAVVKDYSVDEAKIQDYDASNRYKETDLQPGNVNQGLNITDEKQAKDGFKFEVKNPSAESPNKKEWGYQITIDKKTGQRTYTRITVTDGGRVPAETGEKPMMKPGDKLVDGSTESPAVNFKPDENGEVTGTRQRNYNYTASEETLKHINSKDNPSTSFGMKDDYRTENPRVKYFGDNFELTYMVNPWPNENDKLKIMKLNGQYNEKVFVQGQDIDTGIKVDNIDENAKERLVGQVYNPITGEIVPGASAYIGDNGNIHIKMPEGALKKDKDGKTVINEDSIFNTPEFKALQNLDVKFFARPRTKAEFEKVAKTGENSFGEKVQGTYTETGAGTGTIKHKGQDVTIDKQGIDRYDHYNLIGSFKLNLDDTRYYKQNFKDENGDDTSKNTSSNIRPNEPFKVKMFTPKGPSKTDKSAEEMNAADKRGEANGRLIMDFINKANEGKSEDDKWKIEASPNNISEFSITAPASAKAGDFIAIPVEYTYTNGSKDIHWFHFVVKESDNNVPTYESEAGIAGKELKKTPKLSQTDTAKKKLQPKSYKLAKTEYKDDKGNVWNVSIDKTTGEITATVPGNDKIPETGTKLNVDVEVTYEEEVEVGDKKETKTYTEKTRAQFYSIPSTRQEVKKEYETKLPFETKLIYDDTIPAGKVVEEGGKVGKQKMVFSQIVVGNKKGALDENGNFVEGKEAVTTEVVEKAQDKIIKIGTKPVEATVEVPFDTDYQLDYTKKKGEKPTQVTEGKKGEVTVKTRRDPETGEIKITQEVTKKATNRKISIPAGTEGTYVHKEEIPFEVEIIEDNTMDAGTYKVEQEGENGEKKTTLTIENSKEIEDKRKEEITKQPVKKIIKVGIKPNDKMCPAPENPNTPGDQKPNGPKEEDPGTPGVTPNKPNEPGTPGDNTQFKPGKDTPNKPGDKTPSEPGKNTPNKPGENPSEDPKNPPQEAPEKPKLEKENELKLSEAEKVKEAENAKEADEEIETEEAKVLAQVEQEEDEEASRVGNEAGKANLAGDDKAPKTGDAGLMAETASVGLASGLLLLLGRFKRKKEDEE